MAKKCGSPVVEVADVGLVVGHPYKDPQEWGTRLRESQTQSVT